MAKLSAVERETIVLWNEGEAAAEIETHSPAVKKRLAAILRERPEEISLEPRDGRADRYIFPKKWVKIVPPRKATDKQREHLKNARAKIRD